MLNFRKILKTPEVRNSLLFVIAMLFLYRVIAHIPVPGIDSSALAGVLEGNQVLGLLQIFSGGTLENFSIVALGIAPYITAAIIFQLVAMIVPKIEEMQKEEQGRQKINQWTRIVTVPLAALQGYGLMAILQQQSGIDLTGQSSLGLFIALLSMTTGTIFIMWIGELITEKRIGNGVSIMLLATILAGLPTFLTQTMAIYDRSQLITMILFVIAVIVTIVAVVVMNEAQRNIPIQYARQVRGSKTRGGVSSQLPIRVNMAGVMPIIFAVSLVIFPGVIAQFFVNARTEWVAEIATMTLQIFNNLTFYGIIYFVLVFGFTYFYTEVIFHPDRVAENLQKQGGFIPGIRPGLPTQNYIEYVNNRLLFFGGLFLSLIAVLPLLMQAVTGQASLVIGGTSILIIVAVAIDSVKQVEGQMSMREYDM